MNLEMEQALLSSSVTENKPLLGLVFFETLIVNMNHYL